MFRAHHVSMVHAYSLKQNCILIIKTTIVREGIKKLDSKNRDPSNINQLNSYKSLLVFLQVSICWGTWLSYAFATDIRVHENCSNQSWPYYNFEQKMNRNLMHHFLTCCMVGRNKHHTILSMFTLLWDSYGQYMIEHSQPTGNSNQQEYLKPTIHSFSHPLFVSNQTSNY